MTPNKEDYLKAILELTTTETQLVSNKQIATALDVSAASVTEMVAKLLKEGYVVHVPYRGVQLTPTGEREAYRLVRKHRLWEVFLVEKLGFSWRDHRVHEEAERLEHASSDHFIDRLEILLNFPTECPHGGRIPDKNGNIVRENRLRFHDVAVGERFVIARVTDEPALLDYLQKHQIEVGKPYTLIDKDSYDESLTICDDAGTLTRMSNNASSKLFIDYLTNKPT